MLRITRRHFHAAKSVFQQSMPSRFDLHSVRNQTRKDDGLKRISVDKLRERLRYLTFEQLQLRPEVIKAIESIGPTKPSGIQALAIPEILSGKDVLCAAETGTGKTLAYLSPIISRMRQEEEELGLLRLSKSPRAIIVVPSKELVSQVLSVAKQLSHVAKFRAEAILDKMPKCKGNFEGAIDLVVSTPKKLLHYINNDTLSLSQVRYLVVDEADTLMERDFGELMRELFSNVQLNGKQCQHIFVSATIPKSLNAAVDQMPLQNFTRILTPRLHRPVPKLRQRFIELTGHGDSKQQTLLRVLGELPPKDAPTMIFCNTHGACRNLQSWLSGVHEIHDLTGGADHIACIHSRVPREERQKLLKDYLNGKISTLICTDIASRGLDTTNTGHVILYDFPYSAIDYLHRVGRTARSQQEGRATSLVAKKDKKLADHIKKTLKSYS